MYSTHNEGKSVVAERFSRTLKNKIHKHMTAVSVVKSSSYTEWSSIEYNEESNENDLKLKVGDHVRI